jgi:hypothetical protein
MIVSGRGSYGLGWYYGGQKTRLLVIRGKLNAQRYINEVLNAEAIPFMQRNTPVVFQQDNARPHVARITQARLAAANVNVMHWPANSPDVYPVEHIWGDLGRRRCHAPPRTVNELANALVRCQQYVNSMRRRIETLIRARGGHNRY